MNDMATRFADFLDDLAAKIRSLTVDRFARVIRLSLAGTVAAALVFVALIFLVVSIFRAVAVPLTVEGAYAAFGGLFIAAGVLVWLKRTTKDDND
jgi:drug/metabolite transporter superfamily protein YnfA